jgi:hypothetical protein
LLLEPATAGEDTVKNKIHLSVLVFVVTLPMLGAKAKNMKSEEIQQGTVMKVEREEVQSPNQCCYSGSDAP